ncbi:MAG: enterotoxin [Planctomycetes bacterium]|nr:enterotoxin [Planctomycetota bacterium]MBL7143685.1 enterotoxin [Phycisphaerae bacterium]
MLKKKILFISVAVITALLLTNSLHAQSKLDFPGPAPGDAQVRLSEDKHILQNRLISCAWSTSERQLKPQHVTNKLTKRTIIMQDSQCFLFVLEDGQVLKASDLNIVAGPTLNKLRPNNKACRLAEQIEGLQISVTLVSPDKNLRVKWSAILRDGSNYVRQEITLTATNKPVTIEKIVLLELNEPNAKVIGTVDGSPVTLGNMFFAYEHPLSKTQKSQSSPDVLQCTLPYNILLKPGEPITHSSVIGVVPQGQLRRGFLYYVERERVHPYRPFLHYNSWYDIGYGPEKILENDFLDVIKQFGDELINQRNVVMDSLVLDDGWDDPASLWRFHEDFPNGFSNLQKAVEKYDTKLGVWLSPFGGYGKAKEERLKYGRQQGFETNKSGFSLEGSTYYKRFRDVCVNMLREYDLSYFKFDGIGVGGRPAGTNSEFAQDMNALLRLISDLRSVKPDVFINITTGTWSSPFWLWYGDSIWRSGHDWSTHGAGSKRQQQITYRDNETYHNVVLRSPLHPLNSLMTQGFMFANHGLPKDRDNLTDDIRAFFASGTDCQELYVTPSLMTDQDWDALAEAAQWSRSNADVLVDTHWIGGDPAEGEIYGWASWSKRKGILSLRNPHDKPGSITLDIGKAFELPKGAPISYFLKSPWKQDIGKPSIKLIAGKKHAFNLKPFEVLVFDATPM